MKTLYMAGPTKAADGTPYDSEDLAYKLLAMQVPVFASEAKAVNALKQGITRTDITLVKVTIETVGA